MTITVNNINHSSAERVLVTFTENPGTVHEHV